MIITSILESFLQLGEKHPLLVHFPISISFLLGIIELFALKKGRESYQSATKLILYIFLITSFLAVALGLIWHHQLEEESQLMNWHKFAGIATLFFSACCLVAFHFQEFKSYRIFLLLSILNVTLAGYWGGELSHGKEHIEIEPIISKITTKDTSQSLNLLANQILKKHCIDCHNAKKSGTKILKNLQKV